MKHYISTYLYLTRTKNVRNYIWVIIFNSDATYSCYFQTLMWGYLYLSYFSLTKKGSGWLVRVETQVGHIWLMQTNKNVKSLSFLPKQNLYLLDTWNEAMNSMSITKQNKSIPKYFSKGNSTIGHFHFIFAGL